MARFDGLESAAQALERFSFPPSGVVAAEILGTGVQLDQHQHLEGNCLVLAFAGGQQDVQELLRRAKDLLPRHNAREIALIEGEKEVQLWAGIRDLASRYGGNGNGLLLRATGLVSHLGQLLTGLEGLADQYGLSPISWAHAGCAIIYMVVEEGKPADLIRFAAGARSLVQSQGGSLVLESAPPRVKKDICPWGPVPPGFQLMSRIKAAFDPSHILSPGRFLGGI
jgi:FAD/FMN-containing dehydrogenase